MATKKRTQSQQWPRVVEGSHSRFTFYEDGKFDHEIYWDRLAEDIDNAIKSKTTKNKAEAVSNKFISQTSKKTGAGTGYNSTAKKKAANKKGKTRNDELA
jgi:hypothetical protein